MIGNINFYFYFLIIYFVGSFQEANKTENVEKVNVGRVLLPG